MVKYKCVIIDDEMQAINALQHELKENCPEIAIIGQANSVATAVVEINEKKPELIFLDIRLTDGLGFNVLEQINDDNIKVIFTTAYSEHAIQAFRFNAIDYLLKPIEGIELVRAVQKILKAENSQLKQRIKSLLAPAKGDKKIAIATSEGIHLFPLQTIVKLNSERNYTRVYFSDGKTLLSAKTLKEFEGLLAPYQFMRVHQSYIIHLIHIKSYMSKDGGYILMEDESTVPLASRKKSQLLEELKKL
ncbi:LytR/AlgR family response regulator transcription factor [Aureispira anguillae]|uniref:LytTR family DNA-binding domain-containing protein n=1 Tax=Aureispira anguillae TaxID=2864201 RepID=A0A915YFW3_9BACT|nr:LytTR family DNA-binding domain-containing protein [Aureispira anguillae]BDS12228.1 LytTR family DNA-binding domain-containing protein [Aureispira anguillae]